MEKVLKQMGYRKIGENKWAKPVGYHLFTVELDRMEWTNWFMGTNETLQRWNAEKIKEDFNLQTLKEFEAYTRIGIHSGCESKFEFLSLEEELNLVL